MRILFLAPQFPWPRDSSGAQQRTFALLKALSERHEVTLAAPQGDGEKELVAACNGQILRIVHLPEESLAIQPLPEGGLHPAKIISYATHWVRHRTPYRYSLRSSAATELLGPWFDRHDAIFCRNGRTLPLVPREVWQKVVLDIDDFVYRLLRQEAMIGVFRPAKAIRFLESLRNYWFEQGVFRRVRHTLACSENDLRRIGSARKSVVRNGVVLPPDELLEKKPVPSTLAFVGTFGYGPNINGLRWFVADVWPKIREKIPAARLNVIGRNASPETIPFAVSPGIEIVGEVESTAPWVSRSVATVVPLRLGSGTRIKILESLACGRPAVSTILGAEGLESLNDSHGLYRVKDASAMASRLIELLEDPDAALEAGRVGKDTVHAEHSWEAATAGIAENIERWIN
jgi:glycosyltransferase involved in cell wall biosynthesis